jgi:hypothetical protein
MKEKYQKLYTQMLKQAIKDDHAEKALMIIRNFHEYISRSQEGFELLYAASSMRDNRVAIELIDRYSDNELFSDTSTGDTIFHRLAKEKRPDLLETLFIRGGKNESQNKELFIQSDKIGNTAFHYVINNDVSPEVLVLFLQAGASWNHHNMEFKSPLDLFVAKPMDYIIAVYEQLPHSFKLELFFILCLKASDNPENSELKKRLIEIKNRQSLIYQVLYSYLFEQPPEAKEKLITVINQFQVPKEWLQILENRPHDPYKHYDEISKTLIQELDNLRASVLNEKPWVFRNINTVILMLILCSFSIVFALTFSSLLFLSILFNPLFAIAIPILIGFMFFFVLAISIITSHIYFSPSQIEPLTTHIEKKLMLPLKTNENDLVRNNENEISNELSKMSKVITGWRNPPNFFGHIEKKELLDELDQVKSSLTKIKNELPKQKAPLVNAHR